MKWEPIETVPKDGTPVFLIGQSKNAMIPQVGFWDEIYKNWCLDDGENCRLYEAGSGFCIQIYKPTHWMPLPEPPQE